MHIEFLVEDSSGEKLISILLPKLLGSLGESHTWRSHSYKGIGRIPPDLNIKSDPTKRILLDQLPRLIRGYGKTPGIDAVVIVVDTDRRDCTEFLHELKALIGAIHPLPKVLFRLAIEEIEAWYFGDRRALYKAYPQAKSDLLDRYIQDNICETWETLADGIYPGGSAVVKKTGWPLPGNIKHEWAEKIGPLMDVEQNASPSFCKFRDGVRRLFTDDGQSAELSTIKKSLPIKSQRRARKAVSKKSPKRKTKK